MSATLYCGDALAVLRTLPDGVARCCVTSPPYWGLRDYGTARWEGGEPDCRHVRPTSAAGSTLGGGKATTGHQQEGWKNGICGTCGARRVDGQLGLERTPEEYVAHLVAVFREVRRVLAADGTLWLNLGDSYCTTPRGNREGDLSTSSLTSPERQDKLWGKHKYRNADREPRVRAGNGLKNKDMVGIPWRVAFALQADGWWLRSDIIWSKPNPMPESVTDRPTKAHEYLFLLAKAERYFYDAAAIAEKGNPDNWRGSPTSRRGNSTRDSKLWNARGEVSCETRNARTVWEIATMPYPQAHFATFPEELARRCILAGSAPGDTVLDPFGGSGTVAQVATGNGRGAIYIDLNPKYLLLAEQRIGPMLCESASVRATAPHPGRTA